MKKNQIFNIQRFALILRRDIYNLQPKAWRIFLAAFGTFIIIYILKFLSIKLSANSYLDSFDISNKFVALFFVLGLVLTSISFPDFREKLSTQNYLLLPASRFEKFASSWLITTIGFIIAFLISFIIFNLILMILGSLFGVTVNFYNFFANKNLFKIFGIFLLFQSIFFAGATTFKKSPLIMTPFWAITVIIALSIIIGIASMIIFHSFGVHITINTNTIEPNWNFKTLKIIANILTYLTPFVFWAIGYFKITEKQA
jgi:ABC-type transport system involved in multi-copper enzyme maturation permease subunit